MPQFRRPPCCSNRSEQAGTWSEDSFLLPGRGSGTRPRLQGLGRELVQRAKSKARISPSPLSQSFEGTLDHRNSRLKLIFPCLPGRSNSHCAGLLGFPRAGVRSEEGVSPKRFARGAHAHARCAKGCLLCSRSARVALPLCWFVLPPPSEVGKVFVRNSCQQINIGALSLGRSTGVLVPAKPAVVPKASIN